MAPHSSTFAWKIPWTEEPGGLQSMGLLESDMTEAHMQGSFSGIFFYHLKKTILWIVFEIVTYVLWTLWEREKVG